MAYLLAILLLLFPSADSFFFNDTNTTESNYFNPTAVVNVTEFDFWNEEGLSLLPTQNFSPILSGDPSSLITTATALRCEDPLVNRLCIKVRTAWIAGVVSLLLLIGIVSALVAKTYWKKTKKHRAKCHSSIRTLLGPPGNYGHSDPNNIDILPRWRKSLVRKPSVPLQQSPSLPVTPIRPPKSILDSPADVPSNSFTYRPNKGRRKAFIFQVIQVDEDEEYV